MAAQFLASLMNQQIAVMNAAQLAAWIPQQTHQQAAPQQFPQTQQAVAHRARAFRPNIITNSRVPAIDQKKRPLNSYIAFRSYYKDMFPQMQQKEASTYLSILWQSEPFRAKWTILAKAYSIIRDTIGKQKAPLNKFLDLTCPRIGIIGVDEYLKCLNWTIKIEGDSKNLIQTSLPSLAALPHHIQHTGMTEMDIIKFCIATGLIPPGRELPGDLTGAGQNLLATLPEYNPTKAKVAFFNAIRQDPKAIASHILGFEIAPPFDEKSSKEVPFMTANWEDEVYAKIIGENVEKRQVAPTLPASTPYKWSGTMAELYNSEKNQLNFASSMSAGEWNLTDVTNPTALDGYLASAGYDTEFLAPSLPDDPSLDYNFWDSF